MPQQNQIKYNYLLLCSACTIFVVTIKKEIIKTMKHIGITIMMFLCTVMAWAQGRNLELNDVLRSEFSPRNIYGVTPIPGDGEHYSQMNQERTQVIKYSFKTGQQVEVLFDVATAYSLRRNTSGQIRNAVERLSDGGPQQAPVFSPDGSMVAFMRDNNIYLVKLLFGNSESQVTEDGQRNAIINGVPDWVYEEEFSMSRAMEFSADSKMLAFIRYDESKVPTYSFPLFAGASPKYNEYAKYPGAYTYKYPKTGEANSKVEVRTFDIQSKVTRTMQVPLEEGAYITRIYFTKQPDQLAIITMNRHQNRLDMYMGNARSTVCKLVLRDESDTYIKEEVLDDIHFYDNNFTFTSEKSGFNHLYWYTLQGNLVKQVTAGNYEVKEFLGYSPSDETFYFTSNEESPLRKAVYKVDKKGKKTKLSQQVGVNNALFSSNMKYYLNRYTNLTTPTVITLNDGSIQHAKEGILHLHHFTWHPAQWMDDEAS